MSSPIILIGLGQLGRVFAGGLLRTGHTVVPVNRGDNLDATATLWPTPTLVLVAVAEPDLHPVLEDMPAAWGERVGMLQNELLPRDWRTHGIADPTVISVWFEKKAGMDAKPLLPSPAFGPQAACLVQALEAIGLPARPLPDATALEWELVRKNLYILTSNIAGLVAGGNVGDLWSRHRELAENVADEILDIQDWLTGHTHARPPLMTGLLEAIKADPQHGCAGRSAPARLARALAHADAAGLGVPLLRRIALERTSA